MRRIFTAGGETASSVKQEPMVGEAVSSGGCSLREVYPRDLLMVQWLSFAFLCKGTCWIREQSPHASRDTKEKQYIKQKQHCNS